MNSEKLQSKALRNEELGNVTGGATIVHYAYDENGMEYISDIKLAEGACRFLKDRDYNVQIEDNNAVVAPTENLKVVCNVLKRNDFNVIDLYPSMKKLVD